MTNIEIKLELAKAALGNKNLLPTDEGLKNLYAWITEEEDTKVTDKEIKGEQKDNSDKPVTEIIEWINGRERYRTVGFGVRLQQILRGNSINTVDDLLGIGRICFIGYRNVGLGMIHCIDDALEELYGIKDW